MTIHIETDRYLIRDLEAFDAAGIYDLDSDPEVHRFLGNRPITTIAQAEQTIALIRKQYRDNGIGRWAIVDKTTNDFVGWTGLKYEQQLRKDFSYCDLGYRLRRKYWGKGIATETANECLNYGFSQLGINQICAAAHIEHHASNKILSKIGLKLTETFMFDGELHNWYSLQKSEWASL